MLIIIISVAANASKKSTTTTATPPLSTATSSPTTAQTTTSITPPTTTKPAVPVVVWQQSGSGQASGPQFTVPSSDKGWDEVWTYNCSAFGSNGNFATSITGFGGAASTTDAGANQLGPGGSGTNHYFDTGTFTIGVKSECAWTEKVVTVP